MFVHIMQTNKKSKYIRLLIDLLENRLYEIYHKEVDLLTTDLQLSDKLFGVDHSNYKEYIYSLLDKYKIKRKYFYGGHHEYLYIKRVSRDISNSLKKDLDDYYLDKLQSIKL